MESKFKKILLQSTVFTCLSSGVNVTMALEGDRETTATAEYHSHHAENFVNVADTNPAMAAIKKQQQAHRETIVADVTLMLGEITDTTVQGNLDNLKNMIAAALTADADAINDIEDKHEAKKTADVDTAEILKEKADNYNTAKEAESISDDIQHYRLAYFLMLKLQPWLADNYKNDPIEVDILLKDHIPTHYPEWISTQILEKKLAVTLVENGTPGSVTVDFPVAKNIPTETTRVYTAGGTLINASVGFAPDGMSATITALTEYGEFYFDIPGERITFSRLLDVTVNFPVDKTIPAGTKVYKYPGTSDTEVKNVTITSSADKKSAKIAGLTEYGVYYVEIGAGTEADPKHRYYFSVDKTKADQFIYGDNVKIDSTPSNGLKALAAKGSFVPTLTLKLNGTSAAEDTFSASLDGTTWKTLSELSSVDFLKADQTIHFKGLPAGKYIFDVTSPAPKRFATQTTSFTVLPKIISPTATAADKTYNGNTSATATTQTYGVKVNSANFDDATVEDNKEVTVYFGFHTDTIPKEQQANYLLFPTFQTTANINAVVAETGTGTTRSPDEYAAPGDEEEQEGDEEEQEGDEEGEEGDEEGEEGDEEGEEGGEEGEEGGEEGEG